MLYLPSPLDSGSTQVTLSRLRGEQFICYADLFNAYLKTRYTSYRCHRNAYISSEFRLLNANGTGDNEFAARHSPK